MLHSGNGAVGSLDSAISFVAKNGPYASADFDAARNGIKATIINNYPAWISSLAADPAAKWIAVNSSYFGSAPHCVKPARLSYVSPAVKRAYGGDQNAPVHTRAA